jgi:hypothetical protein
MNLLTGDFYILKMNLNLRINSGLQTNAFTYNTGLTATNNLYILANCQTLVFKVGSTSLNLMTTGTTTINAQAVGILYNPYWTLSTSEITITGYAAYISSASSQKIVHKDSYPAMVPKQLSSPTFSFTAIYSNY